MRVSASLIGCPTKGPVRPPSAQLLLTRCHLRSPPTAILGNSALRCQPLEVCRARLGTNTIGACSNLKVPLAAYVYNTTSALGQRVGVDHTS